MDSPPRASRSLEQWGHHGRRAAACRSVSAIADVVCERLLCNPELTLTRATTHDPAMLVRKASPYVEQT
ncbi:protein of unknown function (plasmid) [Cupriavidus taiwanensis]|uniref:Uncharacterized protein n=1 Tax=Cupriavidus taiwanensis TaxID=164546 RepID=A0A375I6W9_9BURK|nr:hypothetical protein CBM2608_B140066 [Cupriavidus taiwanensis]SPA32605.1 hypothetical protein CBM2623_B160066 [Cupriavidus taiwanensis]SPK70377.1 hypothetical protein CT19425_U500016 [Cupriavidus taiwanensis]SPK76945.1 protein of unknown function [Cupriavidus taiwanensis]